MVSPRRNACFLISCTRIRGFWPLNSYQTITGRISWGVLRNIKNDSFALAKCLFLILCTPNKGFLAFKNTSNKILLARPHQTSSMTPRWSQKHHGLLKAVFLVIYMLYIYVYINTIYFRWFIYCRRWYLFWPFLWTIHQPYSRLNISDLARLGLERRLADAETEERHGTRHSERLPSHGSEEHLEGAAGRWGDGMIYRDVQ